MPRKLLTFIMTAAVGGLPILCASGSEGGAAFSSEIRPLMEKYCIDCHDDGPKPKGDVNLDQFHQMSDLWRDPKLWERVLVQLRDRVMPPAKKNQPADAERAQLADWVGATLANPDVSSIPRDPGAHVVHRLNALEYNNTMRDLLGVETHPADQFPPDSGGGGGFDNNAGTLFIPPILLEKYLSAAADVIAAAKPEMLFAARPGAPLDDRAAAKASIAQFTTRAFRRPATDEEITRLFAFYEKAQAGGDDSEAALRLAFRAVLVSPHFLFRVEQERENQPEPYRIGDYELASRLSYFLWSSIPDDALFRDAATGKLHDPVTLDAQVRRMLADPKARTFAQNFASQWLRTKELHTTVEPAKEKFPNFTPELREACYREPVEFFHAMLRDNRPLTDLLDADYTFLNEPLARLYGVPGVTGPEMRRVVLKDHNRGGVLGMAAVLTLSSYPQRTSPVLRGKWVMEEILGTPPPPPPPLVNTQQIGSDRLKDGLTFRQRLEQHREDPKCAGCHARMDPLGFGLENFDAIGAWRGMVSDRPIDAAGKMVTGETFTGPAELKALLLTRKDEFTRTLTEKMLAYALGRGIEPCDWIAVRQIATATASDGYSLQRLVLEVARSFPFQYRRPPEQKNVVLSKP